MQVVKELDLLETRAEVMKLVGPVMVKQNAEEAKSNVEKRVEFIKGGVYFYFLFCLFVFAFVTNESLFHSSMLTRFTTHHVSIFNS